MSIQIEINGSFENVTKNQLFALAKRGDIVPATRVIVNGTETVADKIKGIEFQTATQEKTTTGDIADAFISQSEAEKVSSPPPYVNNFETEFRRSLPAMFPLPSPARLHRLA